MNLSEEFWDNRYKNNDTGWDLGEVSPPLKAYFDQLTDANLKILIPGGGNSYEAEYLHRLGFKNVYVVDLSETALNNFKLREPSFPASHLIHKKVARRGNVPRLFHAPPPGGSVTKPTARLRGARPLP